MALFLTYPQWISPYVIPHLPIRWYSLMYLVAFAVSYVLFRYQCRHDKGLSFSAEKSQDLFMYVIVGLLLGARLFSVFFYSDGFYYLTHPWMIFWPFDHGQFIGLPGMSYHGGLVGGFLGAILFARIYKEDFWDFVDRLIAGIPLGYTFGRLGNFINGELYGRVTTSSIGMVFPYAERFSTRFDWVRNTAETVGLSYKMGDLVNLPRHPSQLYEAFFEGIVLFLLLWFLFKPLKQRKQWKDGSLFAFYLFFYGFFRFFIEYCRQPDADIGYVLAFGSEHDNIALFQSFLNFSKGQMFCALMMLGGIVVFLIVNRKKAENADKRENRKAKSRA